MFATYFFFFLVLYLSVFSLLRLTTFNVATMFGSVFSVALRLLVMIALSRCLVQMVGHFSPESIERERVANSIGRPFTILIGAVEVFGFMIRAISLPLRISTNFTCRHILVVLNRGLNSALRPFLRRVAIMRLETGVCFIQSYVFITLASMYWEEIRFLS